MIYFLIKMHATFDNLYWIELIIVTFNILPVFLDSNCSYVDEQDMISVDPLLRK